jgi:hypothetical protein
LQADALADARHGYEFQPHLVLVRFVLDFDLDQRRNSPAAAARRLRLKSPVNSTATPQGD